MRFTYLVLAATLALPAHAAPKKAASKQATPAAATSEEEAARFREVCRIMKDAAHVEIAANERKSVQAQAQEALKLAEKFKTSFNYGNAIHHANIALGRVDLANNNIKGAAEYLKRAGNSPGSPQLDAFGPNMMLAKELLAKGQKPAVLSYLDQAQKMWKSPDAAATIAEWKKFINAGKMPKFQGALQH